MKMRVKHGDIVVVFAVFDKDVQNLTIEICPLLLTMGENCSLYPHEMLHMCAIMLVLSTCFFDEYLCDIDNHIEGTKDESLKDLTEGKVVYHSSCGSKEISNCDDVASLSSNIVYGEVSYANEVVAEKVNFSPNMYRYLPATNRKLQFDDNDVGDVIENKSTKFAKSA
ncbi:hypothetical protein TSUD_87810 [Trifolium subterraneum]|uniref:Uncharacterized protein n=1 Tax=Trifolium subterraneum TaxID=3900 RepID=A0A2Z6PPN4_TRISU|nr:hypothetical protein TSUD_87810 [Trifolium subterraneum]